LVRSLRSLKITATQRKVILYFAAPRVAMGTHGRPGN
jgi:hypothetical protein